MSVPKIKLSVEQTRSLLVEGECSMTGSLFEVTSLGLFVRFDEGGVLRVVDAPEKRPVGRPKKEKCEEDVKRGVGRPKKLVFIRTKNDNAIFVEKTGLFVVGNEVMSKDGRLVRITRVESKIGRDVSDEEWHSMGCNWVTDKVADSCKLLHLSHLGMGLKDEMGLYWFERVDD